MFHFAAPSPATSLTPVALPTAPQAALYHLNAKFSRHPPTVEPEALAATAGSRGILSLAEAHDDIPLEPVGTAPTMPLGEAIRSRRSIRAYTDRPLTMSDLAALLHYGAGVVRDDGGRATPSGGGRYPVRLVACARRVDGLGPGLYLHDAAKTALRPLRTGEGIAESVASYSLYPDVVASAPLIILLIAQMDRSTGKYGERGYRLAIQEAGHVAQNITLVSTALGLGCVPLSGFDEHDVEHALGLNGESETMLSSVVVGHPAKESEEFDGGVR